MAEFVNAMRDLLEMPTYRWDDRQWGFVEQAMRDAGRWETGDPNRSYLDFARNPQSLEELTMGRGMVRAALGGHTLDFTDPTKVVNPVTLQPFAPGEYDPVRTAENAYIVRTGGYAPHTAPGYETYQPNSYDFEHNDLYNVGPGAAERQGLFDYTRLMQNQANRVNYTDPAGLFSEALQSGPVPEADPFEEAFTNNPGLLSDYWNDNPAALWSVADQPGMTAPLSADDSFDLLRRSNAGFRDGQGYDADDLAVMATPAFNQQTTDYLRDHRGALKYDDIDNWFWGVHAMFAQDPDAFKRWSLANPDMAVRFHAMAGRKGKYPTNSDAWDGVEWTPKLHQDAAKFFAYGMSQAAGFGEDGVKDGKAFAYDWDTFDDINSETGVGDWWKLGTASSLPDGLMSYIEDNPIETVLTVASLFVNPAIAAALAAAQGLGSGGGGGEGGPSPLGALFTAAQFADRADKAEDDVKSEVNDVSDIFGPNGNILIGNPADYPPEFDPQDIKPPTLPPPVTDTPTDGGGGGGSDGGGSTGGPGNDGPPPGDDPEGDGTWVYNGTDVVDARTGEKHPQNDEIRKDHLEVGILYSWDLEPIGEAEEDETGQLVAVVSPDFDTTGSTVGGIGGIGSVIGDAVTGGSGGGSGGGNGSGNGDGDGDGDGDGPGSEGLGSVSYLAGNGRGAFQEGKLFDYTKISPSVRAILIPMINQLEGL